MSIWFEWLVEPEGVDQEETERLLQKAVTAALSSEKIEVPVEIGLDIVSEEEIRTINREQRGIDRVTDVLSFPLNNYEKGKSANETLQAALSRGEGNMTTGEVGLGDIIICFQRAKDQSVEYGHSLNRELAFLAVHSVLHLLGYDHMVPEEEKVMFAKQETILQSIGLTRGS